MCNAPDTSGASVRNEAECDMPSNAECKARSEEGD